MGVEMSLDDRVLIYLVDYADAHGGAPSDGGLAFAFDTSEEVIRESLRSLESDGYIKVGR